MMLANCREHLTPNANGQVDQLGFTPSWNLSTDPNENYHLNPNVVFPPGIDQFTVQPVTFRMTRNDLAGSGLADMPFSMDVPMTQQQPMPMSTMPAWFGALYGVLSIVSGGLSAYHGFKRHDGSIGYGVLWGVLGGMFPVIVPVIGYGQGFAKPMKR